MIYVSFTYKKNPSALSQWVTFALSLPFVRRNNKKFLNHRDRRGRRDHWGQSQKRKREELRANFFSPLLLPSLFPSPRRSEEEGDEGGGKSLNKRKTLTRSTSGRSGTGRPILRVVEVQAVQPTFLRFGG